MPTGRVRWFDAAKGYGFITSEEGKDVFLPAQALPTGVTTLRKGGQGGVFRGGRPSWAAGHGCSPDRLRSQLGQGHRPKADDMAAICEDLIKMLDAAGNTLRRHRYPSAADSKKLATLLRAVADQFDVQD